MSEFEVRRREIDAAGQRYSIYPLDQVDGHKRLPFSLKILLENLLRHLDNVEITGDHISALAKWDPAAAPSTEIAFTPARVLMQDFTGVPCVVDLAAMREAMGDLGGDPQAVNPLAASELVIDHSIVADVFGMPDAFLRNADLEFERNRERYELLRWGQQAFADFKVVPPNTGIVHQVNLEHLARVTFTRDGVAFPDTLVGTDSHTPMVNGLGVLGWGVGGIEAEAAMLGQPVSMLIPNVVGFKLSGALPDGATATDMVLTVTEMLREHGVVGKFVEFYGPGVANVPLANRATIGNMSPEYGSTVAIFPVDDETLKYLRFTGRPEELVQLTEAYFKEQGLWHDPDREPDYSTTLELDLSDVVPSIAGPKRPQDRIALTDAKTAWRNAVVNYVAAPLDASRRPGVPPNDSMELSSSAVDQASAASFPASDPPGEDHGNGAGAPVAPEVDEGAAGDRPRNPVTISLDGLQADIDHGSVAIAAITSCTNTSNPYIMVAAALVAKSAVVKGLTRKPWVKTTLAPGSKVVTDYYDRAGLMPYLEKLGFHLVGYGCTTCIGNSGPLIPEVSRAVHDGDLAVAAVLSGNRNFEGRINPDVKMNYLASPPLVVAYALAGTMDLDLVNEPLGTGSDGEPVFLADIWPSQSEIADVVGEALQADMFAKGYADVFTGDEKWQSLPVAEGGTFDWDPDSTYIRKPPYFDGMPVAPEPVADIEGARVLALLGDSVTTDHISPAGAIKKDSPAGAYLVEHGVDPKDFNSYGSRRGNHEVMIRGTFANIRLRNQLAPGTEGAVTRYLPTDEQMTIFDAAMRYADDDTPLLVIAGKEYGSGSSRDWAAKGTQLLGVRAVIAESYERIHRSNLLGMGVLPLQFLDADNVESLGLTGEESFTIRGLADVDHTTTTVTVDVGDRQFDVAVRIDTPGEGAYFRHGGILPYVLRSLARK